MYLLGLVERTQAAAANLDLDLLALADQGLLVDVGFKPGLGMTVRVAYIVTAHPGLEANLTAHIV